MFFIIVGATCFVPSMIAAFVKYLRADDATFFKPIFTHEFTYFLTTLPMITLSTASLPTDVTPYFKSFPPYLKENPPVAIEVARLKTFWIA